MRRRSADPAASVVGGFDVGVERLDGAAEPVPVLPLLAHEIEMLAVFRSGRDGETDAGGVRADRVGMVGWPDPDADGDIRADLRVRFERARCGGVRSDSGAHERLTAVGIGAFFCPKFVGAPFFDASVERGKVDGLVAPVDGGAYQRFGHRRAVPGTFNLYRSAMVSFDAELVDLVVAHRLVSHERHRDLELVLLPPRGVVAVSDELPDGAVTFVDGKPVVRLTDRTNRTRGPIRRISVHSPSRMCTPHARSHQDGSIVAS